MNPLPWLFVILFCFNFHAAQSQRYRQKFFDSITVTPNILYGMADFYDAGSNHDLDSLKLDFYEPFGDTAAKRPLVITIFGGAFLGGNKGWEDMQAWCDSLAHDGYACASIQYRLLFNPLNTESMIRASYRALQDTRAAIRFMKEYADDYRIDTNKIFLLGNSAGSITALHTVFMSKESERPVSTYGFGSSSDSDDLGCLDCSGNNFAHSVKPAGIISLWGAVWEINWLEADEDVPTLLVHGTGDGTVPYDTGHAFGISFTPFVYGSLPIHGRMDELGIPHEFHPFDTLWHSFYMSEQLDFPNEYWEPVFYLGREFLYKVVSGTFTGIENIDVETEISVYPNPAANELCIDFSNHRLKPVQVSLTNLMGTQVKNLQLLPSQTSLDVSSLPSGIYFVKFRIGEIEMARKIIKM